MKKFKVRHKKNDVGSSFRSDGKLALGITIGTLATVLAVVFLQLTVSGVDASRFTEQIPLIISLLVALSSTYFSANALIEQKKSREASTDPVLIAHLGQRADARELVTFKITNVGAGAALNVNISVESPNESDIDLEKRNLVHNIFLRKEPFTVITQNQSIEFDFAMGWNLLGAPPRDESSASTPLGPLPPFKTKLTYEDLSGGLYESEFEIDVRQMQGLGSQKSPEMRIVAALDAIAKKLG